MIDLNFILASFFLVFLALIFVYISARLITFAVYKTRQDFNKSYKTIIQKTIKEKL